MLRLIRNVWELAQTAATRTVASLLRYDMTGTRTFCERHLNGLQEPSLRVDYGHTYTVEAIMRMLAGARALWERFLNGSQENVLHGYPIEIGFMKRAS